MKKILFILALVVVAITANAQRSVVDTLKGAETVLMSELIQAKQIQALCTQVGGTSDGTLILKGSVDNVTYTSIVETAGMFTFYPNDTLTITDGASWLVSVKDSPFSYYKVEGGGTTSDTTAISIKWAK